MANFIEEKKVINTYVENYVNTVTDFSKYLDGVPSFVTYYSKDINASTEDIGLNGVVEIIGNESPIRYNKISNMPLFNMEEISPDYNFDDENGASTSLETTAIVLPGTIKPLEDDFFTVDYMERKILFRISKVETGSINNRVIYKISCYYSGGTASLEALEEKQVNKKYQVLYENIGKDGRVVIEEDKFMLLQKLKKSSKDNKKLYTRQFFNKKLNTFLFYDNEKYLYDKHLIEFLSKSKLFLERKTFMTNIIIEHLIDYKLDDDLYFEKTLFYSILFRDIESLSEFNYNSESISNSYMLNKLRNRYYIESILYTEKISDDEDTTDEDNKIEKEYKSNCLLHDPYNDCDNYNYHPHPHENVPFYDFLYKNNLKINSQKNINDNNDIIEIKKIELKTDFIKNIIDNNLFENNNFYNIIIKFLNHHSEEEIIENILNLKIKDYSSYEIFVILPCYIYIIDFMINYLQNK